VSPPVGRENFKRRKRDRRVEVYEKKNQGGGKEKKGPLNLSWIPCELGESLLSGLINLGIPQIGEEVMTRVTVDCPKIHPFLCSKRMGTKVG